jgi:AraC-like DNA-binding protein
MDNLATVTSRRACLQELALALDRYTRGGRASNQVNTAFEGITILRSEQGIQPIRRVLKPSVCITIQDREWGTLGEKRDDYEAGHACIVTDEVSCRCTVPVASPTHPYLRLDIELDLSYMQELIEELGIQPHISSRGMEPSAFLLDLTPQLLDCALRSVRLLDNPGAISTLYPGIMREIGYWLLTSPGRDTLIQILMADSHDRRVIQAIQYLRDRFSDPIRVEDLASAVGMSPATFHRQFKSATSTSPLQYQKRLRLLEARRLMITGDSNVESVAFEVGYLSTSQFFREYTRMFGKSPRRDISTWKSL